MNAKELKDAVPEEVSYFMIVEGRYYLATWFFNMTDEISRFGKGGDYNFLVWRKNDEPTTWHLRWRARHYVDEKVFDGKDVKQWYGGKRENCSEEQIMSETQDIIETLSGVIGQEADCLEIRGDHLKFMKLIEENPPKWMHRQTQVQA